jgi:hypothetical protein
MWKGKEEVFLLLCRVQWVTAHLHYRVDNWITKVTRLALQREGRGMMQEHGVHQEKAPLIIRIFFSKPGKLFP